MHNGNEMPVHFSLFGNWESHELWQNYMKAPRAYMVAKVDAVKPVGPDVTLSNLARELSIRTHR
jgi:hypothetical protein